jgi:hypothetical protein
MEKEKSLKPAQTLKLKLSLKREALRELSDVQVSALDSVVGGTGCTCTRYAARSVPSSMCEI